MCEHCSDNRAPHFTRRALLALTATAVGGLTIGILSCRDEPRKTKGSGTAPATATGPAITAPAPDLGASEIAVAALQVHRGPALHRQPEVDEADGLGGSSAARPGNARDRHCDIGVRVGEGAFRHGLRHRLADGSVSGDQVRRDSQELGLGFVRIGDEAPLHHRRGSGDLGQESRHEAARPIHA